MAREAAQKGGIEYIDAWHLTQAHWWASWDGMHYSQVFDILFCYLGCFGDSLSLSLSIFCFSSGCPTLLKIAISAQRNRGGWEARL